MDKYLILIWVVVFAAVLPAVVKRPMVAFALAVTTGVAAVWLLHDEGYVSGQNLYFYLLAMLIGSLGAGLAAHVYRKK